jgi:glyoxylase-like metal-dependent hydrolase (beta-lactamase superfamily II)
MSGNPWICAACGAHFPDAAAPPTACPICEDARQYVPQAGQAWTRHEALARGHRNSFHLYEPGLFGIGTVPAFAIGQRALLIRAAGGNILWDCISLLDDATIEIVRALGGISAIAVSHPHYYTAIAAWAHAFGARVLLHEADRQWVTHPDPAISFWSGERHALAPGITLVNTGGHFEGSTVLHWEAGCGGRGAVLSGDNLQVVQDRRYVSFMRSYPNYTPLPAAAVRRIEASLAEFAFERIYGAWWGMVVAADGKAALARSAARYVAAIGG